MSPSNIHHTLGPLNAPVRILYINPNSTRAFTQETIDHLSSGSRISADVSIDFYTAPADAPPSIDGTLDGVMSTAVILGDLGLTGKTGRSGESQRQAVTQLARKYSAIVVACFSSHPLVPCLKEVFAGTGLKDAPSVVSILEASVHTALQLGPTFGIATTGLGERDCFLSCSEAAKLQNGNPYLTKLSAHLASPHRDTRGPKALASTRSVCMGTGHSNHWCRLR